MSGAIACTCRRERSRSLAVAGQLFPRRFAASPQIRPQLASDSSSFLQHSLTATMQALRTSAASALRQSQRRTYASTSSPYAETAKNLMIVSEPSAQFNTTVQTAESDGSILLAYVRSELLRRRSTILGAIQLLTAMLGSRHQALDPGFHWQAGYFPRSGRDRLRNKRRWWHKSQEGWPVSS